MRYNIYMATLTTLKRILLSGSRGFWRNFSVSLSAVLIIAIALLSFTSMYLGVQVLQASITQLEQKVDVNVYFIPTALEETVLEVKGALEALTQVASVEYVTPEEALETFKANNENNQSILDSLAVLDGNPLGASFNIRAEEISQYANIARLLDEIQAQEAYEGLIDSVNYNQNKKAIDKIRSLIDYAQQFGLVVILLLSLLAIIIVYNTIRLTIYTIREEVSVMRLVGASKFFARGPFVVEGLLYGLAGALLALSLLAPALYYIAPSLQQVFVLNVYQLFTQEFFFIAGSMCGLGMALGVFSSVLAIGKYLDI